MRTRPRRLEVFTTGALVAMCALVSALPASGQKGESGARAKAEAEVRKLEREWLDAYESFDADAMDRIVADDFLITFPDGTRQDKPQLLASLRAPRPPSRPAVRFRTEEVQVRVHGDAVILIGVIVTIRVRNGETVEERMRYTDTYVRRGRRWQVAASGLSLWSAERPPADSTPAAPADSS